MTTTQTAAPTRGRVAISWATILVLPIAALVLTAIRTGISGALVLLAGIVVLAVAPSTIYVVRERRRNAARAAARQAKPVSHCDCCDKACLMAKVCEPGPEPLVTHE